MTSFVGISDYSGVTAIARRLDEQHITRDAFCFQNLSMAELKREDAPKSMASLPEMEKERLKLMEEHHNLTILRQTPQLIGTFPS